MEDSLIKSGVITVAFFILAQAVEIKKEVSDAENQLFCRLTRGAGSLRTLSALRKRQEGKMGYFLL